MTGITSPTKDRALSLLGSGIAPEQVANALAVTPSYISQLLSEEEFAAAVALKRYENLSHHTERDSRYDSLEDKLMIKLEESINYLFQPVQLARVLQIVNAAKRRGASNMNPSGGLTQQVVQISMPISIRQKFVTNIHNQVVSAGDQDLVTIQPKTLLDRLRGKTNEAIEQSRVGSDSAVTEATAVTT